MTTDVLEAVETLPAVVPKESALEVFTAPKGLDPYLARIREEIEGFRPDVTTKKGRDAIASIAHKVAKSKVALDNVGKELAAEQKDVPRKIDAERKRMRDLLDTWKDEVRKPLTDWEQAEEAREAKHNLAIELIQQSAQGLEGIPVSTLRERIAALSLTAVDGAFEEFEAAAHREKSRALDSLAAALASREKYEEEQAELARHRAEAAAREQKEREERIAREAADRARAEAEAAAQAERDAVARREAEAKAASDRRELELQLQAERAEREKAEAIQREERAKQEAETRQQRAVEEERQRVAAEQAQAAAEAARREKDKAHKASINRAALDAFVAGGMAEPAAKQAITLIAKRAIPAVSISY